MQTYEFQAKPRNGVIPIPKPYTDLITDDVTVIIIVKQEVSVNREGLKESNKRKKTDLLPPPILNTRGYKFNRTEANER